MGGGGGSGWVGVGWLAVVSKSSNLGLRFQHAIPPLWFNALSYVSVLQTIKAQLRYMSDLLFRGIDIPIRSLGMNLKGDTTGAKLEVTAAKTDIVTTSPRQLPCL